MLIRDKQFPSKKRIGIEWIMNWNCIPPNLDRDDRVMNSQKNIWIFEFMKENRKMNVFYIKNTLLKEKLILFKDIFIEFKITQKLMNFSSNE